MTTHPTVFKNHHLRVFQVRWAHDSSRFLSAGADGLVVVHSMNHQDPLAVYDFQDSGILVATWSPDDTLIACGGINEAVQIIQVSTGERLAFWDCDNKVLNIAWSLNDESLFVCVDNQGIFQTDRSLQKPTRILKSDTSECLSLSSDHLLAMDSSIGWVTLRSLTTPRRFPRVPAPRGMFALGWSHSGRYLAMGGIDTIIYLWDRQINRVRHAYQGHTDRIYDLAWSPNDEYIVSTSGVYADTGETHIWNVATGEFVQAYHGHASSIMTVDWSPDGAWILTGGWDTTVQMWEPLLK